MAPRCTLRDACAARAKFHAVEICNPPGALDHPIGFDGALLATHRDFHPQAVAGRVDVLDQGMGPDAPAFTPDLTGRVRHDSLAAIPLAHRAAPREDAEGVTLLATDRAAWITGRQILVSGGHVRSLRQRVGQNENRLRCNRPNDNRGAPCPFEGTDMITTSTRGVYAIAPTPFLPDGSLDAGSLGRMTDWYRQRKVDGLTILGIMGEAQKLEPEESLTLVREVIATAAGLPVVVGISAPGYLAMRSLSAKSMQLGAAGVMMTPPSAMRTDDQIVGWFAGAVAAIGADIPWVLQDHPTMTGVIMAPGVISRVVEAHPSCVMLKHEDWPGLEKISTLRAWQTEGVMRPISILCGNGALFLDLEMGRGADGAMTGYAFPEMLRRVVDLSSSDPEAAADIFDAHLPLLRYEHQSGVGLAVRKHILARRGAIAHASLRAPGGKLSQQAEAEVALLLARLVRKDPDCGL